MRRRAWTCARGVAPIIWAQPSFAMLLVWVLLTCPATAQNGFNIMKQVDEYVSTTCTRLGADTEDLCEDARLRTGTRFWLGAGHRVAITGQSGSGKSTLINTLLGKSPRDTGAAKVCAAEEKEYISPTIPNVTDNRPPWLRNCDGASFTLCHRCISRICNGGIK